MSRTIRARLLLAAVLTWGLGAGLATARDDHPPPGLPTTAGDDHPPPGFPSYPVRTPPQAGPGYYPRTPPQATELPPGYPPVDSSHSPTPLRDWWVNGRPLGCWASSNSYGCSSCRAELAFIFGSCRSFYREPCLKGAPPSALPPWTGPEGGYRGHPLRNENGREPHPWLGLGRILQRGGGCPSCQ
jgi:hypothetical protein